MITTGHRQPSQYVIHCVGPVYGVDKPEDGLLANCCRNALRLAEEHRIESIAFPAISTGAFGYPMEDAAEVAFGTIMDAIPKLKSVKRVRFLLHGRPVKNDEMQGGRVLRNEAYNPCAAMTKDEAQRRRSRFSTA